MDILSLLAAISTTLTPRKALDIAHAFGFRTGPGIKITEQADGTIAVGAIQGLKLYQPLLYSQDVGGYRIPQAVQLVGVHQAGVLMKMNKHYYVVSDPLGDIIRFVAPMPLEDVCADWRQV